MIDMATFQLQLQALSITEILWGATYAGGIFEIFSSCSNGTKVRDFDLTHNVVLYFLAIQQTVISSHGVSNLTDPVNFFKCYSFMANLALDTGPFLKNLKSRSADKIIGSMRASAWHAPSPSPTITDTKSEIHSAVNILNVRSRTAIAMVMAMMATSILRVESIQRRLAQCPGV
jgi:hypothetical protein